MYKQKSEKLDRLMMEQLKVGLEGRSKGTPGAWMLVEIAKGYLLGEGFESVVTALELQEAARVQGTVLTTINPIHPNVCDMKL